MQGHAQESFQKDAQKPTQNQQAKCFLSPCPHLDWHMFNCLTKPQKPDRHDGPRLRVPEHLDVQNFRLDVCVLAEDWWLPLSEPGT